MTFRKKLYPSFIFICLLLILFALFKRKNYTMFTQAEPFVGDVKDVLKTYSIVNTRDYKKLKSHKESFESMPDINNSKLDNLISTKVRSAINTIPAVKGQPGTTGRPGPSGGLSQNKGSLTSVSISPNGIAKKTAFALAPIGTSTSTPVVFGEPSFYATTEWTHTADGQITNGSLTPKTICIRRNNDSNLGKNNLLELTTVDNLCGRFTTDNHNRLRLSGTDQCVTVKKKSDIPTNIQIPRSNSYCTADSSKEKSRTCTLDNDTYLLGYERCNLHKVMDDQVFRFT